MATLNGFNANDVDPAAPMVAIPEGKYLAKITESEMKTTKAGDGEMLQFVFTVIDGKHKGAKVWARLNLKNKNDVAVKIAMSELSAICRSVGVMTPKDSVELHEIPLSIHVVCKKMDSGKITNEIKGYEKREAQAMPAPGATMAPGASPRTSAAEKPAWMKK